MQSNHSFGFWYRKGTQVAVRNSTAHDGEDRPVIRFEDETTIVEIALLDTVADELEKALRRTREIRERRQ